MSRGPWIEMDDPVLVGTSDAIRDVIRLVETVAKSECAVLIEGETGTGKELVARRLHAASARRAGPFVPVNCAGVTEALFESQFFGHVRGAFTGAEQATVGLIRSADTGTLFMDEIGEVPLNVQPKLLRALQDRRVLPVGTATAIPTDTRFISATNRNLLQDVIEGRFREDLYYRLNVVRVYVPPLRERPEDIGPLLDHFLGQCAARYKRQPPTVPVEVRRQLAEYPWPGNGRELSNWVERLYATMLDPGVLASALCAEAGMRRRLGKPADEILSLPQAERRAVERAMDSAGGRIVEAANLLHVHRSTLSRKLRGYGLA